MGDKSLVAQTARKLGEAGIDTARLCRLGGSIWLFGSRAAGCEKTQSDWDVLVLTPTGTKVPRNRVRVPNGLDLVFAECGEKWLQRELATHVASYGCLMAGEDTWTRDVDIERAHARKKKIVERRIHAAHRVWDLLSPQSVERYQLHFRREIQRVAALRCGDGIPPSAHLDSAWRNTSEAERAFTWSFVECSSEMKLQFHR